MRDSVAESGRSPRATGSASRATASASAAKSAADAAIALLDALVDDDHEIVTIIDGAEADADDTARITEHARPSTTRDVELEVHHGGQPLYPYLFGIE